jgi:hypothetical protein
MVPEKGRPSPNSSLADEYATIIDILSTVLVRLPFLAVLTFLAYIRPRDHTQKAISFTRSLPHLIASSIINKLYMFARSSPVSLHH